MNHRKVLPVVLFLSAYAAQGQVNCPTQATSGNLVCEVPIGVSNTANSNGGGVATASASAASIAINAAIAAQLTQLPVPSGTAGTVVLEKKGNEFGVPYSNLGPIIIDRPDTIGKGRLYLGFSYQRFNFRSIDGNGLGSLPFAYQFTTSGGPGFGQQTSSITFHLDQFVALATYGATKTTDLSVVVPINSVHLNSTTRGNNYTSFNCSSGATSCVYNSSSSSGSATGEASGVGDVVFSVKQLVSGKEGSPVAVAVGGSLRIPSGDQNNYLGSGAYGVNVFGLVSYRAKFSPHLKISDQFNGPSPLVNTASPNTNGEKNLPGGYQFDAGVDIAIHPSFTAAVDVLANQFINTTSLQQTQLTLTPPPSSGGSVIPTVLQTVSPFNNSYTTINASVGVKYKPIKNKGLLIFANVLYQTNQVGLRSNAVPLIGISYSRPLQR